MIDVYVTVINKIATTLRTLDSTKYTPAVFTNTAKSFSETTNITVYIKQLDNPSMANDLDSTTENASNVTYEIHVYTKVSTGQTMTYNLGVQKDVGNVMLGMAFNRVSSPIEINDSALYHTVARYRRVVADDDSII